MVLQMYELQNRIEAETGRLLRILFLRDCSLPSDSGRQFMLWMRNAQLGLQTFAVDCRMNRLGSEPTLPYSLKHSPELSPPILLVPQTVVLNALPT